LGHLETVRCKIITKMLEITILTYFQTTVPFLGTLGIRPDGLMSNRAIELKFVSEYRWVGQLTRLRAFTITPWPH
jgi:hypothetical protein